MVYKIHASPAQPQEGRHPCRRAKVDSQTQVRVNASGNPPASCLAKYPRPLHSLILAHGEEAVCRLGEEALGFPVTWADRFDEWAKVIAAVQAWAEGGAA